MPANIEIQIDTTTNSKVEIVKPTTGTDKTLSAELNDKGQKAKANLIRTYVKQSQKAYIGNLLDCIEVFSSVSRKSINAAKILRSVSSPYYVRTLLHLLLNLSLEMKIRVLKIIDDLIWIDPALVNF